MAQESSKTSIFLSRPIGLASEYSEGETHFRRLLLRNGFKSHTIGITDFTTRNPLDAVIGLMSKCSGAVVLGYARKTVSRVASVKLHPSEWNHIEAALAYARRIPLLVVHDLGISRGIFDRGSADAFIHAVDLKNHSWANSLKGPIRQWMNEVSAFRSSLEVTSGQAVEKPSVDMSDYEHLKGEGIFRNRKSGDLFCYNCLLEGIVAPLATKERGWQCHRKSCHKFYLDPNKAKDRPTVVRPHSNWVRTWRT